MDGLFSWTRFWRGIFEGKAGGDPAIGSLAIPGDVRIAEGQGSLGRVPRHPAIGQTIDHENSGAIAMRGLLQPLGEIPGDAGREFAIPGVGKPDAAWNIGPWFVAPKGPLGQIRRSWCSWQDVDKGSRMVAPDRFRLVGPYDLDATQGSGRRRPIIFQAVAIRLRHLGRCSYGGGSDDDDERVADGCYPDHGRFESVSAVIGMLVSSRIGML